MRKPRGYWTFEKCKKEALKYKSKMQFKNNNSSAYNESVKNKWLNEICLHMKKIRNPKGYWTFEKCKEEALKYKNKSDFSKNSKSAYLSSYKNGWINDICNHMKPKGNLYKRCIYCYEFSDNSVYVGLTYNINKRKHNRIIDKNDAVMLYMNKTNLIPIFKQLTNYIDVEDAIEKEKYYLNKYKIDNWNILNRIKTGSIGGNTIKWDYESCKNEALKYKNRKSFKENSSSAYYVCIRNKWLDNFCKHMTNKKQKPKGFWSKENCTKYLKKCENLKDFKNKYGTAYNKMVKNKWINDSHRKIKIWTFEKCKEESLKYKYLKDFKKYSSGAYSYCLKNKILNIVGSHLIRLK
ncbi:hypothetical protein [Trichloromonas sp.]|uniref:hypothetical protein n=1 Tax=Trichloromonas sp. TaxID=3069249 RepID=UPI002A4DD913|nr:hypothetical protein [Trichloromonas sp.]